MKKLLPFFAIILLLCLLLAACGNDSKASNAYVLDIDTVYALAEEAGYTGTLEELVEMFRGKNAYQLATEHGYQGTEEDWLQTLVGATGNDGVTPSIGDNGNWFVGSLDTGVRAKGETGPKGNGIVEIKKTATEGDQDTYTIFYDDGSTYDFVVTNGKDGQNGKNGVDGKDGKDGKNGKDGKDGKNSAVVQSVEKTATEGNQDTYTITFDDGSTYDFVVTNGKDGQNGKNGVDGNDGKDGITIDDLFAAYKQAYKAQYGVEYAGTYIDFLQEYLAQTYDKISTQTMVADAVRSCVSVYSTFDETKTPTDIWGRPTGEPETEQKSVGGAGVIYRLDKNDETQTADAYVITNYHVVFDADADVTISQDINVLLYGYENVYEQVEEDKYTRKYAIPATYIGGSMKLDVAVLYIHDSALLYQSDAKVAEIANSNDIAIGEDAIAVGNPKGNGIAVTRGVVALDSEYNEMAAADGKTNVDFRVIRIDTAINKGNSGGGLFDSTGKLIGIVHAKNVESDVDNIAYAIPSNIASYATKMIVERFEQNGRTGTYATTKCLMGIYTRAVAAQPYYDADKKRMVMRESIAVVEEVGETAAAYGKLQKGDILRKIKIGKMELEVTRTFVVVDAMLLTKEGDEIEVTYERDGKVETCTFVLTKAVEVDLLD